MQKFVAHLRYIYVGSEPDNEEFLIPLWETGRAAALEKAAVLFPANEGWEIVAVEPTI